MAYFLRTVNIFINMREVIRRLLRENLLGEEIISGKFYHGSSFPKLEWGMAPESYDRALYGYGIYVSTSMEEAASYAIKSGDDGYVFSMDLVNMNVVNFYDEEVSDEIRDKLTSMPNFYDKFYIKFNEDDFDFNKAYYELGDNIMYDWDYYDKESAEFNNQPEGYFFAKWVDGDIVFEKYGLKKEDVLPLLKSLNDIGEINAVYDEEVNFEYTKDELFNEYHNLYFYIAYKLNSFKEASKFFANLGIDGFKTKGVGVDDVYLSDNDYIVNIINPSHLKGVKRKKMTKKQFRELVAY